VKRELPPDFFESKKLSETIVDQPWYPYEWKDDPTIQSMLVMIDAIHKVFSDQENGWDLLVNQKSIRFHFLPLSEMGLDEELYIKMNSRGRPLTRFEHFKAEFIEIINQYDGKLSKEINTKFDRDWTDMLFPFRGDNSIIDDEFMRYFHYISDMLSYKLEIELKTDEFTVAELLYSTKNKNAGTNIEDFKNALDCWCGFDIDEFFTKYFSADCHENGKVTLYQNDLNVFKE